MFSHTLGMLHCRRKTPPCSPHLHAAANSTDSADNEGHDRRPAGPSMDDAQPMPPAASALFREALHEPKQATSSTRLQSDWTPSAMASGSPEPGRIPDRGPRAGCNGPRAAYNSPVATQCDDHSVLGRHGGVGEEQWAQGLAQRGRQVSRRGRAGGSRAGSSMPLHTAAASTPPLDSEQFGFVRLAASRYLGWLPFTSHVTFCCISMITVIVYGEVSSKVLVLCTTCCFAHHAACWHSIGLCCVSW